jgi:hypothetical protein
MHVMRESWTDARLDDFRAGVDRRFNEVDRRLDKVEGEIRELRSEMKAGFESINRTMIHGVIALSAAYIAGFAAIVTQL